VWRSSFNASKSTLSATILLREGNVGGTEESGKQSFNLKVKSHREEGEGKEEGRNANLE